MSAGIRNTPWVMVLLMVLGSPARCSQLPARETGAHAWAHEIVDASGVAGGLIVHVGCAGLPRALQWDCGPTWTRHHDRMSSVSAVVSAQGRLFWIVDGTVHCLAGR